MRFLKIKNFAAIASLFLIVSIACNKSVNENDPVVIGVKDSTLLIKSISMIMYDPATGNPTEDSVTEYYSYDSVNHKIDLSYSGGGVSVANGAKQTLHYNNEDLLSEIDVQFPVGYTPDQSDYTKIQFQYDAAGTLQQVIITFYGGKTETTNYYKTDLGGGAYQLAWFEFSDTGDTLSRGANFDATGNLVVNYYHSPYEERIDSLAYYGDGSLRKVNSTKADSDGLNAETHTAYDFYSRISKGDQLYNQRRALLNGIQNIPFGYSFKANLTILNYFPNEFDHYEFAKYPFQEMQYYDWNTGNFQVIRGASIVDTKDRLTNFIGFYADYYVSQQEYRIVYYK